MTGRLDPLEAALLAAWNAAEPEGPECHLCGSTAGPWLPDPVGDRWPSGAQKLICSRGCKGEGVISSDTLSAVPDLDAVEDAKGTQIVSTSESNGRVAEVAPAVIDLLSVIRDLADVPLPSLDDTDERAWHTLMLRRLGDLHVVLSVALAPKWAGTFDPAREAEVLRDRLNATPVTYTRYGRGAR